MTKIIILSLVLICINISSFADVPSISMTTTAATGYEFKLYLKTTIDSTTIQIDYGDGTLVDKIIEKSGTNVKGAVKGTNIAIYGDSIVYMDCRNCGLTSLDISNCTTLTELFCNSNSLTSLDLSNNKSLVHLYCGYNNLSSLDISNNKKLTQLSCGRNNLTSLDVSNNAFLIELLCEQNNLTSLDLSICTGLQILYCYKNNLTYLNASQCSMLIYLLSANNQLSLATLPKKQSSWSHYSYAPQKNYEITKSTIVGSTIDLSNQYSVDENTTSYVWKTKSGTELTEGIDYEISDGVTTFLKTQSDSVYCEMTNDAFPDFTGDDIFKTTTTCVTSSATSAINEETVAGTFKVYSGNNSIIVTTDIEAQLTVYNVSGNKIVFESINVGNNTISGISSGVYIIKINTKDEQIVKKVFVR